MLNFYDDKSQDTQNMSILEYLQLSLTTCWAVAVNGKPRMRMMTWPPLERKACASELLPVKQVIIYCIGINLSSWSNRPNKVATQDYLKSLTSCYIDKVLSSCFINFNVSLANMMFMPFQCQISVLFVLKSHQCFPISSTLRT